MTRLLVFVCLALVATAVHTCGRAASLAATGAGTPCQDCLADARRERNRLSQEQTPAEADAQGARNSAVRAARRASQPPDEAAAEREANAAAHAARRASQEPDGAAAVREADAVAHAVRRASQQPDEAAAERVANAAAHAARRAALSPDDVAAKRVANTAAHAARRVSQLPDEAAAERGRACCAPRVAAARQGRGREEVDAQAARHAALSRPSARPTRPRAPRTGKRRAPTQIATLTEKTDAHSVTASARAPGKHRAHSTTRPGLTRNLATPTSLNVSSAASSRTSRCSARRVAASAPRPPMPTKRRSASRASTSGRLPSAPRAGSLRALSSRLGFVRPRRPRRRHPDEEQRRRERGLANSHS